MTTTEQSSTAAAGLTPSQAIVAALRAQRVDLFFGLDGDHVIDLFDALAEAPDIRPVTVRHENNAAIAAEVYARATGRPGVLITTAGPGATNALSGVAGAFAAGVPIVHLSGGVPRGAPKEAFHGVDDPDFLRKAFEPITKSSVRVEDPREIVGAIERAFTLAVSGRPGPVRVEIALSALQDRSTRVAPPERRPADPPAPTRQSVPAAAAARIDRADQIAIVAGKNAWWPRVSAELARLAERLGAPVGHTWDGQGAIPSDHPLAVGPWGASTGSHPAMERFVAQADLVIGVGVRRDTQAARDLELQAAGRLLLIDAVDVPAGGDDLEVGSVDALATTLADLAELCRDRPAERSKLEACARARELLREGLRIELERYRDRRPFHVGLALDALGRRMTPDTMVISDVSNVKLWAPVQLPIFSPQSHLQSGSWGAMGYVVPGVLAAGLARPDKKVVGLCGDTSFQMGYSDFGTICQLGLPVVIAVHADGQIGMINDIMTMTFGRPYATDMGQVDFVQYARAFGARGLRVDDPADLDAAWDEALAANEPVLLELRAGYGFPRPWPVARLVEQATDG